MKQPDVVLACPHCRRPTLSATRLKALDDDERAELLAAGTKKRGLRDGTCTTCYAARRDGRGKWRAEPPTEGIAYEGGWVNRGGVMYPMAPRPRGEVA